MTSAASQIDTSSASKALQLAGQIATGTDVGLLPKVSAEDAKALSSAELRAGLDRVLLGRHADQGLEGLLRTGLLTAVLPEVAEVVGIGDGENMHKDVWKHTKQVVIQSVPRLAVRWAALMHDIAKPRTRSVEADGSVHFLHHPEVGAKMFDRIERRLGLFQNEGDLKNKIRFLILHHQRAHQYEEKWTDSAIRRFGREMGEHLDDVIALSRADMTTKRRDKRSRYMFQLKELTDRIAELAAEDAKVPPLPKGLGEVLSSAFGIPPSRKIGDIRRALEDAVQNGEIPAQQPAAFYVDFVAANRERFGLSAGTAS
jgi:poly(A) polymerase